MFKEKKLMFLIAETPLHPGSGSELGIVDLPIQRERYTEFPKIEASGLKGSLREAFEQYRIFENKQSKLIDCEKVYELRKNFPQIDEPWKIKDSQENLIEKTDKDGNKLIEFDRFIYLTFGPEDGDEHAGAMTLTDARLLLFPVKSLKGVFAWITCPMVLERFRKDLQNIGIKAEILNDINFSNLKETVPKSTLFVSGKVVLEEFTFQLREDEGTSKLANFFSDTIIPSNGAYTFWKEKIKTDLVIINDDDFEQFVKYSTEVITRTKIDNKTGTVQRGALWTEEYLPQDTILYSLLLFTQPRVDKDEKKGTFKGNNPGDEVRLLTKFFDLTLPPVFQLGGNQTIGKGFVRVNLSK